MLQQIFEIPDGNVSLTHKIFLMKNKILKKIKIKEK